MPSRILRDGILTSPRIAKLGWAEEVFYRRLMSVVDDFGRYYGDPGMLRAACYPRQLSKVNDSDIGKWTRCLAEAGLVRVYDVSRETYIELLDFRQQVRAKASKFPDPSSECLADATQPLITSEASVHLDVDVVEDVSVGGGVVRASARPTLPTDEHLDLAIKQGVDCQAELDKYRDWLAANGRRHKDEVAGFRNWLKGARPTVATKQDARARVNEAIWGANAQADERVIDGEAKRVA